MAKILLIGYKTSINQSSTNNILGPVTGVRLTCKLEAKLTGMGKDPGAMVMVWSPDTPELEEDALTTLDRLPRLEGLMTWMTFSGEIPPPSMMIRPADTEDEEDAGETTLEDTLEVPSAALIGSTQS